MKDADKMSNAELRREIAELREGKCRNNCRTVKEAYLRGWRDCVVTLQDKSILPPDEFDEDEKLIAEICWTEWRNNDRP